MILIIVYGLISASDKVSLIELGNTPMLKL